MMNKAQFNTNEVSYSEQEKDYLKECASVIEEHISLTIEYLDKIFEIRATEKERILVACVDTDRRRSNIINPWDISNCIWFL
ncbi:MAG: hypothetical protein BAJALOKI1v1_1160007 [Promethearchaeota archaeon]|nr:MAG: hypothetical protein BAJALOKI1v1_1160007 [Candidatus Lokiarchaeota archaeon]